MPLPHHYEIAKRLSLPIPSPPKPVPKLRASFGGFKVGDQLAGEGEAPAVVEVTACDTEGLWVRRLSPRQSAISSRLSVTEGWRKLKKKERLS